MILILFIVSFLSVIVGILIGSILVSAAEAQRYSEAFDMGRRVEQRAIDELERMLER